MNYSDSKLQTKQEFQEHNNDKVQEITYNIMPFL